MAVAKGAEIVGVSFIYVLVDPRTQEIRYVGRTSASPELRLRNHCTQRNLRNSQKDQWVAGLLRIGFKPLIETVQEVPSSSAPDAEQYWIDHLRLRGCDLLNVATGRVGRPPGPVSSEPVLRVRLPRQLLAQAQEAAQLRDVGVNLLFERALRDYLVRLREGVQR